SFINSFDSINTGFHNPHLTPAFPISHPLQSLFSIIINNFYRTTFFSPKKKAVTGIGNDFHSCAQRRLTLTGGDPQLPSAQKSLTSVFGMGTGVASLPSSLDYFH